MARTPRNLKLVVRPHTPWRTFLGSLVLAGVLGAGAWSLFEWGREAGAEGYGAAVRERERLGERLARVEQELEQVRAQSARLQTTQRVDQEAYAALQQSLTRLQQENQELREELQFYRNIVSPAGKATGPRVQRVVVEPAGQARHFRYRVTVINVPAVNQRHDIARGHLQLALEGSEDGVKRQLTGAQLGASEPIPFEIKYFRQIEGEMRLPEAFKPAALTVRLVPKGKAEKAVEHRVPWPQTAAGAG